VRVQRELGMVRDALNGNLGLVKQIVVVTRPEFPPEPPLIFAGTQSLLKLLEVGMQAGVSLTEDVLGFGLVFASRPGPGTILAGRNDNMPLVCPLARPALNIPAAQELLDQRLTTRMLPDEVVPRRRVNVEGVVKARFQPVEGIAAHIFRQL